MAIDKTEAMVFHGRKGKRPPKEDKIKIDKVEIEGRRMKYLGIMLDTKLNFTEHFKYIKDKVTRIKRALGRLMPNLRGPSEKKRKLYGNIIQPVVMYGAPIWGDRLMRNRGIQRPLKRTQRYIATRIIAGYRTVAFEVVTLLARTLPWVLVAEKCERANNRMREVKLEGRWDEDEDRRIREEEESRMYRK